ncbi:MAG: T9SS type A sorting domain-containing protein [Chitinophagales bacterium]
MNGSFGCVGGSNCSVVYTWIVYLNNSPLLTGTSLPVSFTTSVAGTYSVVISTQCNGHDCETYTFTFKVKNPGHAIGNPLSTENNLPDNIQLIATPNPAPWLVTLHLTAPEPESGLIIWYDALGTARKHVFTAWDGSETEVETNVGDLSDGIYFVRFSGVNGSGFTKVIVYR